MIIYKTTNKINGKIYIGKYCGKLLNYLGSGTILKKAIKKYGKENFDRETLEDNITDHDFLCLREIYWIKKYDATNPDVGYNLCNGGEGGTRSVKYKASNRIETKRKADGYLCAWENYCETNLGKNMKDVFNSPQTKKEEKIKESYIKNIRCIYGEYCQTHFRKSLQESLRSPRTKQEEAMKRQYHKSIKAEKTQNLSGFIRPHSKISGKNHFRIIKEETILEILNLLNKNMPAKDIAKNLDISQNTVYRTRNGFYNDIYDLKPIKKKSV